MSLQPFRNAIYFIALVMFGAWDYWEHDREMRHIERGGGLK